MLTLVSQAIAKIRAKIHWFLKGLLLPSLQNAAWASIVELKLVSLGLGYTDIFDDRNSF